MNDETNNQLYLMLGRLEGKVDAFLSAQKSHEKRVDDLETRVSSLETIRAQGRGMLLLGGAFFATLATGLGFFADTISEVIRKALA